MMLLLASSSCRPPCHPLHTAHPPLPRLHCCALGWISASHRRRVPAVTGALVKQVRLGLEAMLSSMAGRQDKAPTPAELALVDAAAMLLQAEDGVRSWG